MAIVRDNILCNNITFIDGFSGSGKSLIAPFISSLPGAELWKLNHLYEYIIILLDLNKISLDAASALLKIYADMDLYNLSISRDVNFRKNDDSSPFYNLQDKKYIKRLDHKGGDETALKILKNTPSLLIMTHFIANKAPLIDQIFHDRNWKLIVILRHPATVIKNWHESGFFERHNKDPREFTITENTDGIDHPWYARKDKLKVYSSLEHIADFVISYFHAQDKIYTRYKKHYIKIYFEVFEISPHKYLSQLESVYGQSSEVTIKLMAKFGLPRKSLQADASLQNKDDLTYVLSLIQDKSLKNKLTELCQNYEADCKNDY